jgi:hypothetical protein
VLAVDGQPSDYITGIGSGMFRRAFPVASCWATAPVANA